MLRSTPCSVVRADDPIGRPSSSETLFQQQIPSERLQSFAAATSTRRTSGSRATSILKFASRSGGLKNGFESRHCGLDGRQFPRGTTGLRDTRKRMVVGASGNNEGGRSNEEDRSSVTQLMQRVTVGQRGNRADVVEVQIEKLGQNSRKIVAKVAIAAPLDNVWAILTDYEHLADFIPGLAVNQVLEKRHNGARLYQVGEQNIALGVKFKAKAVVDCKEKPPKVHEGYIRRDIDFETVEGDFQTFRGTWRMEQPVRRPFDQSKVRNCREKGGLLDLCKPSFVSRAVTSSRRSSNKLRLVRARASVEDGVESSDTTPNDETRASTTNSDPPTIESSPPSPSNPFASGKISRIVVKQAGDSKTSASAAVAQKAATPKKPVTVKPPPAGQLSANAASQLKVSRQPSVFTTPTKPTDGKSSSPFTQSVPSKPASPFTKPMSSKPKTPENPFRKTPLVPADWEKAGARPAGSGKRVLDAFREGDKEGTTTKFGQPVVPTNIFDDVRRTPEEIAADAFKFEISPGQLLLAGSFLIVVGIMFGTVFLVWKVGAIHYNEF